MNKLPRQDETASAYAQRLLNAVKQLKSPKFIRGKHRQFKTQQQAFAFSEQELAGMKLFFSRGSGELRGGNCVS